MIDKVKGGVINILQPNIQFVVRYSWNQSRIVNYLSQLRCEKLLKASIIKFYLAVIKNTPRYRNRISAKTRRTNVGIQSEIQRTKSCRVIDQIL